VYTLHWEADMRTNIVIDDGLMQAAMKTGRFRTKRAAVEAGLRLLREVHGQGRIRALRGKVRWRGDLRAMRAERIRSGT
jgi:Arc/MetJ family transcription regulator